ncbi:B-4DMT family transporter [Aldersonia kunmingensis]|uniref:B-4DMT family transporter n=1 Tax=Aldersonia kunmingensis TaxID=408066 RepID=UPI000831BF0C|nr:B-4DMT family transporter [Aldersonia kunmingensis]
MNAWVVRGLVLAVVNVAVRALLGFGIGQWPMQGTPMRLLSLLVVILAAAGWGYVDAKRDRAAYPGEDEGADLTMLWLKAAILGGLAGGALAWLVDMFPSFDLGDNPLFFELTAGAAWTILLIFVPAMIGIGIGHFIARRAEDKAEESAPKHSREPVAVGASGAYGEAGGYDPSIFPTEQRQVDAEAPTEQFPAITDRPQDGKSQ